MFSIKILLHISEIVQMVCTLVVLIRPSIEYGSEVWECNNSQAGSLESLILDRAKPTLAYYSKTCNETVRGDMGLNQLRSFRDSTNYNYNSVLLPQP